MTATNPFAFIVGCPRSGTTLLRHMLGAHPQIAITPEAHWIAKSFEKRRGLTADGHITPKFISELLANPKFELFHLSREEINRLLPDGPPLTYGSFLTAVFDLYGKSRGKALVGNKTPDAVRKMATLHALWPSARFIHLIRDGRDVALSFFNWRSVLQKKPGTFPTWKEDRATTCALWWELNVRRGREAGARLGPELYYEMRYESLVQAPERECAALCAFLGVPFDPVMLRFHENRPAAYPALEPGHGWRPLTAGARDWRREMAAEEVEHFEAAAGALLDELGYPRAFPQPGPEANQRATHIRALLAKESPDVRPYARQLPVA
jgi:sulfotransferase family protein